MKHHCGIKLAVLSFHAEKYWQHEPIMRYTICNRISSEFMKIILRQGTYRTACISGTHCGKVDSRAVQHLPEEYESFHQCYTGGGSSPSHTDTLIHKSTLHTSFTLPSRNVPIMNKSIAKWQKTPWTVFDHLHSIGISGKPAKSFNCTYRRLST